MAAAILVIVVIVIVTLFSVQNATPVTISFLVWRFDASLAVIALLFFSAGLTTGVPGTDEEKGEEETGG